MDTSPKSRLLTVVRGHCPADHLPEQRSWTVRVYLASTPDMAPERDTILREVYPRLKHYCAGKYGIDFKFVELHWGVKESTCYQDNDINVIRREIHLSQQRSLGPNFLGLLGNKLGSPLLPLTLSGEHYLLIQNIMCEREEWRDAGEQMEKYYRQLPCDIMDFQPIFELSSLGYNVKDSKIRTGPELADFRRKFRESVMEAARQGHLLPEDVVKYTPTLVEIELEAGIGTKDSKDLAKDTSLYLIRNIRDLSEHQGDPQFGSYCDLTDGLDDDDLQNRLLELREVKLRQLLPASNIKQVMTDWDAVSLATDLRKEDKLVSKFAQRFRQNSAMRISKYEDYMDDIINKVYSPLKQLVDRAAAPLSVEKRTLLDQVYADVIEHWRFMQEIDIEDCPQEAISSLQKYLDGDMTFTFILQGRYLSPRSAIITSVLDHRARTVSAQSHPDTDINGAKRADSHPEAIPFTVIRYLSFYQDRVTLQELLTSICTQVFFLYQKPWQDATSVDQVKHRFEQCLFEFPTAVNPLHIVLDGIELLATPPSGLDLTWIPDNLPENVKIIVTCCSSADAMLEAVSSKTPYVSCIFDLDQNDDDMSENSSMKGLSEARSSLNLTESFMDEESTFGHGKASRNGTDYQHGTSLTLLKENMNGLEESEYYSNGSDNGYGRGATSSSFNERNRTLTQEINTGLPNGDIGTNDMNASQETSNSESSVHKYVSNMVKVIVESALMDVVQRKVVNIHKPHGIDPGYDPYDLDITDSGALFQDDDERPETPRQMIESDYQGEDQARPEPIPSLDKYLARVMEEEWGLGQESTNNDVPASTRWLRVLEERHGRHLVASVFTFLSCAKKGLTESELLDLMSLDEELLNEGVFLGVQPFLRRIPELLWARLSFDLGTLLQVKDTDQRDVLSWSLPDLEQLTKRHYINMVHPAFKVHQQMALYFMNLTAKPRPMDDSSVVSSIPGHITEPEVRVDPQPSVFEATDQMYSRVRFNKRRLTELPHHLLHAEKITDLCRYVVFSYRWLYNKLNATSPYELISTLRQLAMSSVALREEPDVLAVISALEESMPYLQDVPSCLRAELTGRLLPRLGNSPSITNLIRQCDDEGYKHCHITPLTTSFDEGQDEVEQIIPCDTGFYDELYMTAVPNTNHVITYTVPEKLSLWDISTEEMVRRFECNQYTYCTDMMVSRDGRFLIALNNGQPRQSFLEDSPLLDIYDLESGEKVHRIYFKESDQKPKRLFRVLGLKERRLLFDTPNYVAVCIDMVRLCHIKSGKEISKITWPFIVTPDERYLILTEHDGHRLVLRSFPDLQHITKFASPKNITAMVAIVTGSSMDILVAAGSAGILSMYNLDNVSQDVNPIEPVFQGVLVDKKDGSVKGGCGSLILSPDNSVVIAVYIHSSGHSIMRTNFLVSTKTLENIHIYESEVKDTVQFTPDGCYVLHLKAADGTLDIIETATGDTIRTSRNDAVMKQICFGADANTMLVATKEEIQLLGLSRMIEQGKRNQCEEVFIEDDVSVELNKPKERIRTLTAEIPLSAIMSTKSLSMIPVKLVQVNESHGTLMQTTIELLQGTHFTDSEFPSYMSETLITPDGSHFLVVFEQLHVVGPKKGGGQERKVLSGPLKEDFHHTKVTSGSVGVGGGRDVFGVGTNNLSHGTTLQKGTKIYGTSDTKRGTIFEADGGETIQRCPSVIRIYNAESGHCTQCIQIQNEKVLTTSNLHVVTSSSDGAFTNIYDITTGESTSTLECGPASATFTIDHNALVLVPKKPGSVLMIFRGPSYLDLRKCEVMQHGKLHIWEVMTCSHSPGTIIVSMIGEGTTGGVAYARVDVTYASVINTFSCHAELVQISPKGNIGVDSEFRFYDIAKGRVLFQVLTEEGSLTEHASYITDDGSLMVYLDYETGKINVVDVQKKKLVSQCFFHPHRSRRNTLRGVREMVQVIPLHGGQQMVVLDNKSIKQFLLQTPKRQSIAFGMVKLRQKAYVGPESRLAYYHIVNSDGDVPLTRGASKRRHRQRALRVAGTYGKRKL